jgi:hypothetical protein
LLSQQFQKDGYAVLRSAIPEQDRGFLYDYVIATLGQKRRSDGDSQVPGTPAAYADFAMETLLEKFLPELERVLGFDLFPTYSYLRLYKNRDTLAKHRDRPACEISCTLCLGYGAEGPWPIWVEVNGQPIAIHLNPADMLIYKGIEIPHWRERFEGTHIAQVFLHYVNQTGPCREWKFDKRTALRTPLSKYS